MCLFKISLKDISLSVISDSPLLRNTNLLEVKQVMFWDYTVLFGNWKKFTLFLDL